MWQRLIWLIFSIIALFIILIWYTTTPHWVDSGELSVTWSDDQSWELDGAEVRWDTASAQLSIYHNQTPVWASSPERPWLSAAVAKDDVNDSAVARGVLHRLVDLCSAQTWTEFRQDDATQLVLIGEIHCGDQILPVTFTVQSSDVQPLRVAWEVDSDNAVSATGEKIEIAATFLDFSIAGDEAFFGFGPQAGGWNRRGERVSLQRTDWPDFSNGAQGHLALSSAGRAFLLPVGTMKFLDLRSDDTARLETWHSTDGAMTLFQGSNPAATLTRASDLMGRMSGLPESVHRIADAGSVITGAAELSLQNSEWLDAESLANAEELLTLAMVHETGPFETGWGPQRGLQASLIALLNGGVSGTTVAYSRVGGTLMAEQLWWQKPRSMELFLRWLELNTFTAWLRLDEGDQFDENFQVTDSVAGEVHFDRLARLYYALTPYREQLMAEAREKGWPVVRPIWFEYPEDPVSWSLSADQFLLGSQLLVVPVITSGTTERTFYLPPGEWTHLWNGVEYDSVGEFMSLATPIGEPLVLVRHDFPFMERLLSVADELVISR